MQGEQRAERSSLDSRDVLTRPVAWSDGDDPHLSA
jgi:hypothetical protein